MRIIAFVFLLGLLSISSTPLPDPATDVRLPKIFSDGMVLQRDQPIPVFGMAEPGGEVAVTLGEARATATADVDGRWKVELPPMEAGGPHELVVAGADTLSFADVLVGEVWVASGQSNMAWSFERLGGFEDVVQAANHPQMRLFTVERDVAAVPLTDVEAASGWTSATPEAVRPFSAVAYYFGKMLQDSLGVPVGLINTTWGGTPAEAWTGQEGLENFPVFQKQIERLQAGSGGDTDVPFDSLHARMNAAYEAAVSALDAGYTDSASWADPSIAASGWSTMPLPANWEAAGLEGLDGVVWFRRDVTLPTDWASEDLTLHLGPVDDADTTWVNGRVVGSTAVWETERAYPVPAGVTRPGLNTIAVRVVDTGGEGGFRGEADALRLERESGARLPLEGPWSYQVGVDLRSEEMPPRPPRPQDFPSGLYNAMVHPLVPYGMRGVIWYQGETNAGRAYQYRTLFAEMIRDWRQQWGQGDFPFLFVQLANFMAPQTDPNEQSAWAELREAQAMALDVPNTGMAVAIDIGEADDIHPRNKEDVGHRLARWALAETYGRDGLAYSGPRYQSMEREGEAIRIRFDHAEGGLTTPDGEPPEGFVIAGPDSVFVQAEARIEGDAVVVTSPDVRDPLAVRYGWANNPRATLYNEAGLPTSPFRTDDWPGVTEGVE